MTRSSNPNEFREPIARLVRSQLGGEVVQLEAIAPGAGTRLFLRVHLADCRVTSAIARIDRPEDPAGRPAGVPAEPALEPLRSFLEEAGLPVPRSYGSDGAIQLLEDAGELSLEDASHRLSVEERRTLYADACRLVPRLQSLSASPKDIPAFGRRLDASLFRYKADLFAQWALPLAFGRAPAASESAAVREAFAWIASECEGAPHRLSHRDFKAANLQVGEPRNGTRPLVLIDLQGAFMAPPEYDLVCLLRDSHVEIPEAEVEQLLASVRPHLPDAPNAESFQRRFELLTMTRVAKDLARYIYLSKSDSRRDSGGDPRFLRLVPRAISILKRASSIAAPWDPCVARLAELFDALPTNLPEAPNSAGSDSSCAR